MISSPTIQRNLSVSISNSGLFWEHCFITSLSVPQRQWLSERVRLERFPPRSTIFHASDGAEGLYFVLEGKVKVEVSSGKGDWIIKKICSNGDFFGTKGLFGQPVRRDYARALRDEVRVVYLSNAHISRLMEVNFQFAEQVFELLGRELQSMEERMSDLSRLSARQRFVKFVLSMTDKWGCQEGQAWGFNSQLTQAEIGTYIGTGRQTVTELLNELKSKGILQYSWGRFTVQQIEALRMI